MKHLLLNHRTSLLSRLWPIVRRSWMMDSHPIIVGPFVGEVGLEGLYWQPFITRLARLVGPDRIIAIVRGGLGDWYRYSQQGRTVELYDHVTPQDVRMAMRVNVIRSNSNKMIGANAFVGEVAAKVATSLGVTRYHHLDPRTMFNRCSSFWSMNGRFDQLYNETDYHNLAPPVVKWERPLPRQFAAVKWYDRPTWPMTAPLCQTFMEATLETILSTMPAIIMETGFLADDHVDFQPSAAFRAQHPTLTMLSDHIALSPTNNLAAQYAAMGTAAFVAGTYGGFNQVAVRMGMPTILFTSDWEGVSPMHHYLCHEIAIAHKTPYQVFPALHVGLTRAVVPIVKFTQAEAREALNA